MDDKTIIPLIYFGYIILASIITFCTYAADKNKAKKGKWRVKEATLLTMSILGGAIGGLFAMNKFRHKTTVEHWYFYAVNILGILIHAALGVFLIIKF